MAIKYTPFFLTAFLAGVMLRSLFYIPTVLPIVLIGLCAGVCIVFALAHANKKYFWIAIIMATLFFMGMIRLSSFENNITGDRLHLYYNKSIHVKGNVSSVDFTTKSQRVVVDTLYGKTLVITGPYPRYSYGDILDLSGTIKEPESYGAYDSKKILARDLIFSQLVFPSVVKIGFSPNHKIVYFLYQLKDKFEDNIRAILPEPHASLANGMVLGDEGILDKNILDTFRKSGTIHILVLSGSNITIVGLFVMALLRIILPFSFAWAGSIAGIIAFTIMTGGQAPAVRAAIMAIIGLIALRGGRNRVASFALLWAAFLMVLWNPMTLRWDRGFQLSFLATLGLIVVSPVLQQKLSFLPSAFGIRESGASTLAAQLFVLPLLLSWGSEISFLSPIANIFIAGIVPLVMLFCFLGGIIAFVSVLGGTWIASVAYILISFQIFVARVVSSLPSSSILLNGLPFVIVASIYGILGYITMRFYFNITPAESV